MGARPSAVYLVHEHLRLMEKALERAQCAVLHLDVAHDNLQAVLLHLKGALQCHVFLYEGRRQREGGIEMEEGGPKVSLCERENVPSSPLSQAETTSSSR